MSELYWRAVGPEDGPLVVFCHGLFGQGKNWGTVTKALSARYRCVMVDLPNHGRSPWRDVVDYDAMATEVIGLLTELGRPATLVGHSMGGKIVMRCALRRPELVEGLVVVDMAPAVTMAAARSFDPIYRGLLDLDLDTLDTRAHADEILSASIPDDTVRGFLMQNLRYELHPAEGGKHWRWQMNLAALAEQREAVALWPDPQGASYDGPSLWIAGGRSQYIRDEHTATMRALFPRVRKVTIKDAGHWVHSEQPAAFIKTLRAFLDATQG